MRSSIHNLVLQTGLPSLDGKFERFVTKKMKKAVAKVSSPTGYIATEIFVRPDADHTAIISHMYVQHTNLNPSYLLSAIFIFMYTPCWQTNMRK